MLNLSRVHFTVSRLCAISDYLLCNGIGILTIKTDMHLQINTNKNILNFPANLEHAKNIHLPPPASTCNDNHILVLSGFWLNTFSPKMPCQYFPSRFFIITIVIVKTSLRHFIIFKKIAMATSKISLRLIPD